MSPDEAQLRAALRDGEGDVIDADSTVSRGALARRARHRRCAAVGGAVVLVAAISVGGVVLAGGRRAHPGQTGAVASSARAQRPTTALAGPVASSAGASCPATLPTITAPVAGGPGQFFAAPAKIMTLCQYRATGGGLLHSTTVLQPLAQQTADSLETAPTSRDPAIRCPYYTTDDGQVLLMIAVSPAGIAMAPVAAELFGNPCNQPVTNGVAVRYNWSPPSAIAAMLQK